MHNVHTHLKQHGEGGGRGRRAGIGEFGGISRCPSAAASLDAAPGTAAARGAGSRARPSAARLLQPRCDPRGKDRAGHGGTSPNLLLPAPPRAAGMPNPRDAPLPRGEAPSPSSAHSPDLAAPVPPPPRDSGSPVHGGVIHTVPDTMEIRGRPAARVPAAFPQPPPARLGSAPPAAHPSAKPRFPSALPGSRRRRARARSPPAARPRAAPAAAINPFPAPAPASGAQLTLPHKQRVQGSAFRCHPRRAERDAPGSRTALNQGPKAGLSHLKKLRSTSTTGLDLS